MLPALSVRYNNKKIVDRFDKRYELISSCSNHNYNKIVKSDWLSTALISALLRAVVFQLNLNYLHVKITNLLWVVV